MNRLFSNQNQLSRWVVLLVFFIHGCLVSTWFSRIPAIQSKLNLSEGELGLALLGMSVGVLLALSMTGGMNIRFGSKNNTLAGTIMICITLPFIALTVDFSTLWLSLFVLGAGLSVMDVAMNEQAVLVERNLGRPVMSSFHAAYSVGGLAGALVGSGMASQSFMIPFFHFTLISILLGALMLFLFPHLIDVSKKPDSEAKPPVFRLPERAMWGLGAIAFSSSIGEGAMADWSAVYLSRELNTDNSFAALGYAAFSLTMTAGRLLGDRWATIWPAQTMVKAGGILSTLGFLLAILTDQPFLVLAGFAAVGLGLANIIPLTFSAAGNHSEIPTSAGIASVATIGYGGFLAGPPVLGLIAEVSSLRFSILLVALLTGTLLFSAKAIASNQETN